MASKTIAILQSNYLPWKGYFDLIQSVDEFVLYDSVQYTKRDWRNRNRIKTATGMIWVSVPVEVKGKYFQSIGETKVADLNWSKKHWNAFKTNYGKAPCFEYFAANFQDFFQSTPSIYLSEINRILIEKVCGLLRIETKISSSMDYGFTPDDPTDQLLSICVKAGATKYVSGPAAKSYMKTESFSEKDIAVGFFNYDGYREYPQAYPPFDHAVSIVDLLCNTGENSAEFLKRKSDDFTENKINWATI